MPIEEQQQIEIARALHTPDTIKEIPDSSCCHARMLLLPREGCLADDSDVPVLRRSPLGRAREARWPSSARTQGASFAPRGQDGLNGGRRGKSKSALNRSQWESTPIGCRE